MSPRPDVSEERKSQIIQAAIRVFAREGVKEARMDDVAQESGLSKGLLYWYFKSKDDIIIAIAGHLFDAEFEKFKDLSWEGRSACACLEEFFEMFIDDLRGMLKIAPVIYEFYALAFRSQTIRKIMQAYLARFIAMLSPILEYGIQRGEFTPADTKQIALVIGSALEGTLLLWGYAPDLFDPETQLQAAMQVMLNGLLSQS